MLQRKTPNQQEQRPIMERTSRGSVTTCAGGRQDGHLVPGQVDGAADGLGVPGRGDQEGGLTSGRSSCGSAATAPAGVRQEGRGTCVVWMNMAVRGSNLLGILCWVYLEGGMEARETLVTWPCCCGFLVA